MYKRLLLFGIAPTDGLRRGQAERLFRRLEEWCRLAVLSGTVPAGDDACLFHVDLSGPDAPRPGPPPKATDAALRVLDVTPVLAAARRLQPGAPSENAVPGPAEVDAAALARLIGSWSGQAQRRGERTARSEPADVETSLKRIRERLLADAAPPEERPASDRSRPLGSVATLALQTIERADHEWQGERKRSTGRAIDLPGAWGTREEKRAVAAAPSQATPEKQRNWALVDASAGGFRLRWEGETSSPAAVGELVALRQELPAAEKARGQEGQAPLRERWSLGVIRRIRMIDDSRFDAGVEILGRHPVPAVVRREPANPHRKRDRKREPTEPALMLPALRGGEIPATVLVPAHLFQEGEVLELDVQDRVLRIRLGSARESSSAFTRFEVRAAPSRGRSARENPA